MKEIVPFSMDEATYVGDENDGVYYQVAPHRGGWYVTTVIDCNTAHFTETAEQDAGPFNTEEEAREYGENAAAEWCIENGVSIDE